MKFLKFKLFCPRFDYLNCHLGHNVHDDWAKWAPGHHKRLLVLFNGRVLRRVDTKPHPRGVWCQLNQSESVKGAHTQTPIKLPPQILTTHIGHDSPAPPPGTMRCLTTSLSRGVTSCSRVKTPPPAPLPALDCHERVPGSSAGQPWFNPRSVPGRLTRPDRIRVRGEGGRPQPTTQRRASLNPLQLSSGPLGDQPTGVWG